jgi:hypothetical protein
MILRRPTPLVLSFLALSLSLAACGKSGQGRVDKIAGDEGAVGKRESITYAQFQAIKINSPLSQVVSEVGVQPAQYDAGLPGGDRVIVEEWKNSDGSGAAVAVAAGVVIAKQDFELATPQSPIQKISRENISELMNED